MNIEMGEREGEGKVGEGKKERERERELLTCPESQQATSPFKERYS